MTLQEPIEVCFSKYADFSGRARRPEYWWFILFIVVGGLVISAISRKISGLFTLGTLLPSIAAGARRLHDTNRSGWWQLIVLVPAKSFLILVALRAQVGQGERDYRLPR